MHTKLKLKIELFNDIIESTNGTKFDGFFFKLTVLDKDERFETCDKTGDYIRFQGEGFTLKSNKNKKFGSLNDDSFILPNIDRMGFGYNKWFVTDNERYNYLKKLYDTLYDWSNYWWAFEKDSISKIVITENIWEVVCDSIEKDILYLVY